MNHYVVVAGMHGCDPEAVAAARFKDTAIEAAQEEYGLTDGQASRLRKSGLVRTDPYEHTVDFVRLVRCDCDEAEEHEGWNDLS